MNKFETILDIALKWKKVFLINFLVVIILSTIVIFLLPVWFAADTTFFTMKNSGGGFNISGLKFGGLGSDFLSTLTPNVSDDRIKLILQSRTLYNAYDKRFHIRERYDIKESGDFYLFCKKNILVSTQEVRGLGASEIISFKVKVFDKDRDSVASMADFIVEETNRIATEIVQEKSRELLTILKRIKTEKTAVMDSLASRLIDISSSTGILPNGPGDGGEYSRDLVELEKMILEARIKLEILDKIVSRDSYEYKSAKTALEAAERMRLELLGRDQNDNNSFTMGELASAGYDFMKTKSEYLAYLQIMQDLEFQIEVQKEKLDSMVSPLTVMDKPFTPDKKAKPQRKLLLLVVLAGTIMLHFIAAILIEKYATLDTSLKTKINRLFKPSLSP